jgi:hypothetical protein
MGSDGFCSHASVPCRDGRRESLDVIRTLLSFQRPSRRLATKNLRLAPEAFGTEPQSRIGFARKRSSSSSDRLLVPPCRAAEG